jgi:hypothetical protein
LEKAFLRKLNEVTPSARIAAADKEEKHSLSRVGSSGSMHSGGGGSMNGIKSNDGGLMSDSDLLHTASGAIHPSHSDQWSSQYQGNNSGLASVGSMQHPNLKGHMMYPQQHQPVPAPTQQQLHQYEQSQYVPASYYPRQQQQGSMNHHHQYVPQLNNGYPVAPNNAGVNNQVFPQQTSYHHQGLMVPSAYDFDIPNSMMSTHQPINHRGGMMDNGQLVHNNNNNNNMPQQHQLGPMLPVRNSSYHNESMMVGLDPAMNMYQPRPPLPPQPPPPRQQHQQDVSFANSMKSSMNHHSMDQSNYQQQQSIKRPMDNTNHHIHNQSQHFDNARQIKC